MSSVIHVFFPKRRLAKFFKKNIYSCYGFLESKQESIKRISLNTQTLIMVFNEILIPQDFFFRTTVTRQKIRRRKFVSFSQITLFKENHIYFRTIMFLQIRGNNY